MATREPDEDIRPALGAALAEIGERWTRVGYVGMRPEAVPETGPEPPWLTDVPCLVSALDEVLKLHVRQDRPVRWWKPCKEHEATRLPRPSNIDAMKACPDCTYQEQWVCLHCQCPHDEWPCPTVQAIATALGVTP